MTMTTHEWEISLLEARREALARELGTQDYVLRTLFGTLADIRATLAEHEDADCDGDPAEFRPNWAMRLVRQIDETVRDANLTLARTKAARLKKEESDGRS